MPAPRRRITIDPELIRAQQLLQLGRHEEAERLLGRYLTNSPNDARALSWLALAVASLDRRDEAAEHAARAVQVDPGLSYAWFVLGIVALQRRRLEEAEHAAREAIQLDPDDAESYALLAQIHGSRKHWDKALAAAEDGLRAEPDNDSCTNLRAFALRNLGRTAEATHTLEGQLARTPDDSSTHANHGWTRLQMGDYDGALQHFREALRLDPSSEWARNGIVETLKARHWFYRPVLRYFLWMQRLPAKTQVFVLIGAWILYRIVNSLARQDSVFAPLLWAVMGLYFVFVATSWFASPIANALLSFHPLGRMALTRQERAESWTITGLLTAALVIAVIGWLQGGTLLIAGFALAILCLPLQQLFQLQTAKARTMMWAFTAIMAAVGVFWVVTAQSVISRADEMFPSTRYEIAAEQEWLARERERQDAEGATPAEEADLVRRTAAWAERIEALDVSTAEIQKLEEQAGLRDTIGLVYAILGFWISQIVAGALASKVDDG